MPATSSSSSSTSAEKVVVFLVLVVVFDFDILDGDVFVAFDHAHAGFRLGFFFLGGLVFFFAGGGDDQRRFLDGRCLFLFLGFGLAVFVLVFRFFVLGLRGATTGPAAGSGWRPRRCL